MGRIFISICILSFALVRTVAALDLSSEAALQAELDRIRIAYQIPGMAAAVVVGRELKYLVVSGERKVGSGIRVETSDAFQIGSITKPITSMLAYVLAQKKILPINTRIVDVFPELRRVSRREYRTVTVEMLLTHLAAFPYKPLREGYDEFLSISKSLKRRRYEYVKAALRDKPAGKVGQTFVYSGGTIIVAAMMERKTGKRWEDLVRKYIFNPLRMTSAGFGASPDNGEGTGVWEHQLIDGVVTPILPPSGYASEPHAPAGRNVHVSARDLVKFMISNFPYGNASGMLLPRQAVLASQKKTWFADVSPGWFISNEAWSDWKTVYHNGDNGKSIATLVFSPKYETGFVIMANVSGNIAWQGVNELAQEIEAYLGSVLPQSSVMPTLHMAQTALSYGKPIIASNIFYDMPEYGPSRALDGAYNTRWATDYGVKEAWLEVDLGTQQTVKGVLIKEEFAPRVSSYVIWARSSETESYVKIAKGTDIGDELVLNTKPTPARFIRLDLKTDGDAGPTISEFQVFGRRLPSIH